MSTTDNSWSVSSDSDPDRFDYKPIPASWIRHPAAYDRSRRTGPRLLAVSAATYGSRTLRIKYAHPRTGMYLVAQTPAESHKTGTVPQALKNHSGWPRSRRPGLTDPKGRLEDVEVEHMQTIWADHLDPVPECWTVEATRERGGGQ